MTWIKIACITCKGTGNVHVGGSTLDEDNYEACPHCTDIFAEEGTGVLFQCEETGTLSRLDPEYLQSLSNLGEN